MSLANIKGFGSDSLKSLRQRTTSFLQDYNLHFYLIIFHYRLVTSDLLFYSSSLKQYSGFADLDNRFDGLWSSVKEIKNKLDEQKYNQLVNKQIETKPKKFPNR